MIVHRTLRARVGTWRSGDSATLVMTLTTFMNFYRTTETTGRDGYWKPDPD